MFEFNCFCIDLTQFETESDILEFLKSNGIEKFMDSNILYKAKNGEFTNGVGMHKIWVDQVTFSVFAYRTEFDSKFTVQYVDYMNGLEPLQWNQGLSKKYPVVNKEDEFTIDDVLDKINNLGIDSLTEYELKILRGL